MATQYPAKIDDTTSSSLPDLVDGVTNINAEVINRLRDAIIAVETELGVLPSSIYTTVRARLEAIEDALISGGGGGGGTPGGGNGQVQFNDFGAFGGNSGLTYDKVGHILSISDGLSFGTGSATTGVIRLKNLDHIMGRDVSDLADYSIAYLDNSNYVTLGAPGGGSYIQLLTTGTDIILGAAMRISSSVINAALPIALGTTPALSGDIRSANGKTLLAARYFNTTDYPLIAFNDSANLIFGGDINTNGAHPSGYYFCCNTGSGYHFEVGGTDQFAVSDTIANFAVPVSLGATPATTGTIRLPNTGAIYMRNAANSANLAIIQGVSNDSVYIGSESGGTDNVISWAAGQVIARADGGFSVGDTAGNYKFHVDANNLHSVVPIIGGDNSIIVNSPYGVHGVGTQAMADADQTPAGTIYKYNTIKTTGAITANRNLVLPAATDTAGYTKVINNICTGAFSVVVGDGGAGTTVTVNNGFTATVLFDSRGATSVGATQLVVSGIGAGSNGQVISTVAGSATWVNQLPARYELTLASGLFTTTSATFIRTGARQIDMSLFPATIGALTRTVVFSADVDMTGGATSIEFQLYDSTHTVAVTSTDLTSSSTTNVRVTSGALTVGSSAGNIRSDVASQYELQFKMNGGGGGDAVFLTNARITITYA